MSYRTELWDRPGAPEVDHITRAGRYWWADPAAHPYRAADQDRPEDGCASCGYLAAAHSVTP